MLTDKQTASINVAIEMIQSGKVKRVDIDNCIKVYQCKNVIRIDIIVQ